VPDSKDKFANQAYLSVTETGANTLTFNQLLTGISIYEKVGWLINRLDYTFSTLSGTYAADGDGITFGIGTSSGIATVGLEENSVIDYNQFFRADLGAAASGFYLRKPFIKDFSSLPGGGILVPPNPLYIWAQGVSLAAAQTVYARMFYTVIQLKAEDFWELVEMRRMIGA